MSIYSDKSVGGYVFEFRRKINGKRFRIRRRLPKTWNRAKAEAYDRQECARLFGIATGVDRPAASIDEAVTLYLQDKQHLKSFRKAVENIAAVYWAYQGRTIDELPNVARDIASTANWAAATIKQRIALLRAACRWAWKHHNLCEHDPGSRVVVPKVSNSRTISITERELLQAIKVCPATVKPAIMVAFYSGMRLGEIVRAKPIDGVWQLSTTKNGDPRYIPIHPKVAKFSAKWSPANRRTIQKWWKMAAISIGRPEVRFHDLRHSSASAMINAGVPLYTVGQVLGHKSPVSTQRYAHLAHETLKEAVEKIGKARKKVPISSHTASKKSLRGMAGESA